MRRIQLILIAIGLCLLGCDGGGAADGTDAESPESRLPADCLNPGTAAATASCLKPSHPPEYYEREAEAYFDTLDVDASRESVPVYHAQVARWEWPPWLLLTGYTKEDMTLTSDSLRVIDPSTVPIRDCRFFETQPFARCYVEFEYERGRCPIYEEFTFNDAGEMTFIEAWSNLPGLLPNEPDDPWAEAPNFPRLANKIPGLGNSTGTIDLMSEALLEAAMSDPEIADFSQRAENWRRFWFEELMNAEGDFFGIGCGWPPIEE